MRRTTSSFLFLELSLCLSLSFASATAQAGARDQALRIFNRLTGVPPTPAQLDQLEAMVKQGQIKEAAYLAMDQDLFYTETLKKMFAPWSNEAMSVSFSRADGSPGVILNDYTATLIGMVRDDKPFNEVMTHDYVYVAEGAAATGLPAYSESNNEHYEQLEQQQISLKEALVERKQVDLITSIANREAELGQDGKPLVPAGILTSRGFSEAYYNDGTNRSPFRFMLMTYLCEDVQTFHDTTIVTDRIRRDVERNALFVTKCQGCHAGMDGMTGAFAYLDWDLVNNRMIYSKPGAGVTLAELQDETGTYQCANTELNNNLGADQFSELCVRPKYRRNSTEFPDGHKTVDDSWINYWNQGQNAEKIGWAGTTGVAQTGKGPRSLGEMIGNSKLFATCMAKRSFKQVCFREPSSAADTTAITQLATNFQSNNYSMKSLMAESVGLCLGE